MKASSSYAAFAALAAVANARHLARAPPEPTHSFQLPDDGVSPRPTEAVMELFRRADKLETLWAPDNTCGFISGREGAAYTCNGNYQCAFETGSSTGNVGCCSGGVCNMRYSCVDYESYWSSSACDDGCAVDALTLKCTASSAPYCNTISFSGGITDFWCNNLALSSAQRATTTFSGGDQREYTTADETTSVDTSTIDTTASDDQPTVTVHASASSSSGSSSDSADDNGGSKSNTGAIVGGVVGGVAGLALIGAGLFFLFRNKKKKEAAAAPAGTTPPAYQAPPMQQQPGTGPGGYNPVPQGQTGFYDPKNPYTPSPGAQYNSPVAGGFYQPTTPDPNQHDPRLSAVTTSPAPTYNQNMMGQQPGYQNQQAVIHEAPTDNHARNETHELA